MFHFFPLWKPKLTFVLHICTFLRKKVVEVLCYPTLNGKSMRVLLELVWKMSLFLRKKKQKCLNVGVFGKSKSTKGRKARD